MKGAACGHIGIFSTDGTATPGACGMLPGAIEVPTMMRRIQFIRAHVLRLRLLDTSLLPTALNSPAKQA